MSMKRNLFVSCFLCYFSVCIIQPTTTVTESPVNTVATVPIMIDDPILFSLDSKSKNGFVGAVSSYKYVMAYLDSSSIDDLLHYTLIEITTLNALVSRKILLSPIMTNFPQNTYLIYNARIIDINSERSIVCLSYSSNNIVNMTSIIITGGIGIYTDGMNYLLFLYLKNTDGSISNYVSKELGAIGTLDFYGTEGTIFDHKLYMVVYFTVNPTTASNPFSGATTLDRKIMQCNINNDIIDLLSCQFYTINSLQYSYSNSKRSAQIKDKFLIITPNKIVIGLNQYTNTGSINLNCQNSIMYGSNDFSLSPSLHTFDPSCISNSLMVYTRFILKFSNNSIMIIGFDCLETDRYCDVNCNPCLTEYITLRTVEYDFSMEILSQTKIPISDNGNNVIYDAIISMDNFNLYMLSNNFHQLSSPIGIYILPFSSIPLYSSSSLTVTIVKGIQFAYNCSKIHEIFQNYFIVHCLTNDEYSEYYLNQAIIVKREIFYFITRKDDSFIGTYYIDNFSQKYYKVSSSLSYISQPIFVISSMIFFEIGQFDQGGSFSTSPLNPQIHKQVTFINAITQFNQQYFLSGCYRKASYSLPIPVFYVFNQVLSLISENNFPLLINSCIKDQLLYDYNLIILSIPSKLSETTFSLVLYSISPNGEIVNQYSSSTNANYEEFPILKNSLNEVLVARTKFNSIKNMRYPSFLFFNKELHNLKEEEYSTSVDVATNTVQINANDHPIFGGSCYINLKQRFWMAFFTTTNGPLKNYCSSNSRSSCTASSRIASNVLLFGGFIGGHELYNQYYPNVLSNPFVVLVSNYATSLYTFNFGMNNTGIFSSIRISENQGQVFFLTNDLKVQASIITIVIQCPSNNPFIGEIENGCFKNCLTKVKYKKDIACNPDIEGCNKGYISQNNKCINDNLILIKQPKQQFQAKCIAYMVNSYQLNISCNDSLSSSSQNLSITVQNKTQIYPISNFMVTYNCLNFNKILITFQKPEKIFCITRMSIDLKKMNIQTLNRNGLVNSTLIALDLDKIPCPKSNISNLSSSVISMSEKAMTTLVIVQSTSSLMLLNPMSLIQMANSMEELMIFQLLNSEPDFPNNVNELLNTAGMFTMDFLNNPLNNIINSSNIFDPSWFVHNIGNHNSLSNSSFLYNFSELLLTILEMLSLLFILFFSYKLSQSFRFLKSSLQLSYIIEIIQGLFIIITITSFASIFYDNRNFDNFTFSSILLSYIILFGLSITFLYLQLIFIFNNSQKLETESEEFFGILYDGIETSKPQVYETLFMNVKLLILILVAFAAQDYSFIQLILFFLTYLCSILYKAKHRPSSEFLDLLRSLLRENLFVILVILFAIFIILLRIGHQAKYLFKDIIFFNIIAIMLLEFGFSNLKTIISIISGCCEERVRSKLKIIFTYNNSILEEGYYRNKMLTSKEKENKFSGIRNNKRIKSETIERDLKQRRANIFNETNIIYPQFPTKQNANLKKRLKNSLKGKFNQNSPLIINCLKANNNPEKSGIVNNSSPNVKKVWSITLKPMITCSIKSAIKTSLAKNPLNNNLIIASSPSKEVISIHLGCIASRVGNEFWNKLSEYLGLFPQPSKKKEKIHENAKIFFNEFTKGQYEPRALYIDYNSNDISNFSEIEVSRFYNFSSLLNQNGNNLINNEDYFSYAGPFYQPSEKIKQTIGELIRRELERSNSIQGVETFISAREKEGSDIGSYIHQLLDSDYPKIPKIDFPIFHSMETELSPQEIFNELNTISFLERYSHLVLPFGTRSIFNKIANSSHTPFKPKFNEIEKVIVDSIFVFTSPLFQSNSSKINFSEIISLLVLNAKFKFISSNIFPLLPTLKYSSDDFSAISQIFNDSSLTGGNLNSHRSISDLIISTYPLKGQIINKIQSKLKSKNSNNIVDEKMYISPQIRFLSCNMDSEVGSNASSRLLYCSNSSSISLLFANLKIRINSLFSSNHNIIKRFNSANDYQQLCSDHDLSLNNLISVYESL